MDFHAAFVRTILGPLWARWERSPYLNHLHWLRLHQFDKPELIRGRQWAAVRFLVRHAYASVPYYRQLFDRVGIHPSDIHDFEDFARLPVLTKDDLRRHGTDLLSNRFAPSRLYAKKTSGSTGKALTIWIDEDSLQWKRACAIRSDEWSGWRFGEPVAKLWGNPTIGGAAGVAGCEMGCSNGPATWTHCT